MRQSLDGRTAIVTGASAGIGAATARELGAAGMNVVLAARREDRLAEVAEAVREASGEARVVPTDVTEAAAVDALVETTVKAFDGLDLVVSNAGLARGEGVGEMTTEEYRTTMAVNCDGTFFLTRAALPHLRTSEGSLVFVGSFAGHYPRSFNPVYAASKFWTRGFAHSVSAQVGSAVGVSVVNPSEVRTEFGDGWEMRDRYDEDEATGPEEVAEAVRFVAEQAPSSVAELDLYRRDKFADTF